MTHALRLQIVASCLGLLLVACGDDADESPETSGSTSETSTTGDSETTANASSTGPSDSTSTTAEPPGTSSESSSTISSSADGSTSEGSTGTDTGVACVEQDVELPGEAFYPEGVAAHGEMLFVGSVTTGEIVRANTCTGVVENFVPGGTLPAAIGLRVDDERNILWACGSDTTQAILSSVNAFDLDSGEHLAAHPWTGPGMCNDLDVDDVGNVYATDSFGHRILRVASEDALEDTAVETWLADPAFVVPAEEIGLNGIVWDAGRLWVVNTFDGRLFDIAVQEDGSPGAVTIAGDEGTLSGPDGVIAHDDGLLVVEGVTTRISHVDSNDLTVTMLADGFDFPTTVAVIGETAWVAEGQFDHLFGSDKAPPNLPFRVRRVPLR